jgi:hypothetical protein
MRASIRDKKRSRYATSDERNSSEKVRDLDVRGFHENDGRLWSAEIDKEELEFNGISSAIQKKRSRQRETTSRR